MAVEYGISQALLKAAAHIRRMTMAEVICADFGIPVLPHALKAHGVGAYLGGSYAETEISGAVSAHIAVATQPDMVLAKPAMDVDAAITIVGNEQARVLAMLAARAVGAPADRATATRSADRGAGPSAQRLNRS